MGALNLPNIDNTAEVRQDYQAAMQLLDNGIVLWDSMTGTQKQAWIADNMDSIMRILRAVLKLFRIMIVDDSP